MFQEILSGYSNYAIDKTDVFSYGVLLYELYTQKVPFSDPQYAHMGKWGEWNVLISALTLLPLDIQNFVKEGKRLEIPKSVPRQIRVLIERCWDQEPNNRPDFGSIVKDLEALYQNYLKDGSGGTNSVSQQQSPSESTRTKKSSAVSRRFLFLHLAWACCSVSSNTEKEKKDRPKRTKKEPSFRIEYDFHKSFY